MTAAPPQPVEIIVEATAEPPFLDGTGTFEATGALEADGDARAIVWLAGETGHVELRLGSRENGILIWAQTTFENPTPDTLFAEGPWVIIDASGSYEGLHGFGWMIVGGTFSTEEFTYLLDGKAVCR